MPDNIKRFDLRSFEEKIRYIAKNRDMRRLESIIKEEVEKRRIFFLGSGDFHHVSYSLIKQIPLEELQVVVFDNHPDNMFLPYGIHCGSWVYHASRLPNVSTVSVFGIASKDLTGPDLFQNRFSVVKSGKVKYYSLTPVSRLANLLSGYKIVDLRNSTKSYVEILREDVISKNKPVYLSIDKDVLSDNVVRTTWDQGRMSEVELLECVRELAPYAAAADVVGDISFYNHRNPVKRLMRCLDKYEHPPIVIEEERLRHANINMKILSSLNEVLV